MSDRHALLAAVIAAPADDTPRLVFADWLDEQGDAPRAAVIREQVASGRPSTRADHAWLRPLLDAFEQSAVTAAGPLAGLTCSRGFVEQAGVRLGLLPTAEPLKVLFAEHPVTKLTVELPSVTVKWDRLAIPEFRRVSALTLVGSVTEEVLDAAFAADAFAGVTRLTLNCQPLALASERLARSPLAKRLTGLRMPLTPKAFAALDRLPHDDRIRAFALLPVRVTPPAAVWSSLSRLPFRPTVRHLDLSRCRMTDDGLSLFARGETWVRLTALRLSGNGFGDAAWPDFCRGWRTPELRTLDVSGNALTGRCVPALVRSHLLGTVRVLDLSRNKLDGKAALELARAVAERAIDKLHLRGNTIAARDAAAIRKLLGDRTDIGGTT